MLLYPFFENFEAPRLFSSGPTRFEDSMPTRTYSIARLDGSANQEVSNRKSNLTSWGMVDLECFPQPPNCNVLCEFLVGWLNCMEKTCAGAVKGESIDDP